MADKRLFFALWPDDRQRDNLRDVIRPLVDSVEGKLVDRRNWHVTLVFIGAFPEEKIPLLLAAASRVECAPFRLRMDRLTYWARPKIACLQAMSVPDELARLKAGLEDALLPLAIEPEVHTYRPHITLARNARHFEAQPLERPVALPWSGCALMESVSTGRGVQYRPLKQ